MVDQASAAITSDQAAVTFAKQDSDRYRQFGATGMQDEGFWGLLSRSYRFLAPKKLRARLD